MRPPDGLIADKRFVRHALGALAATTPARLAQALEAAYHPDAGWRGSHPLNEMTGTAAMAAKVWLPLLKAFPDLERRDTILVGGDSE